MPAGRPKGAKNGTSYGKPKDPNGWIRDQTSKLAAVGPAPASQQTVEVKPIKEAAKPAEEAKPTAKKPIPPMPKVVTDFISEIPYKIAKGASEEFILNRGLPDAKKTKLPDPEAKSLEALHEAFATWMRELELDAGPTAQLIIVNVAMCGAVAMQAGIKRSVINAAARAEERAKKEAAAKAEEGK